MKNIAVTPVSNVIGILDAFLAMGLQSYTMVPGPLGNSQAIAITSSDMATIPADAYVCPHLNGKAYIEGVNESIMLARGAYGFQVYHLHLQTLSRNTLDESNAQQNWGDILITPSGGGLSDYFMHAVCIGNLDAASEFKTVELVVNNVMKKAREEIEARTRKLNNIIFPALGTGELGCLPVERSAIALLSAVEMFWQNDKSSPFPQMITVALGDEGAAYSKWVEMLQIVTEQFRA